MRKNLNIWYFFSLTKFNFLSVSLDRSLLYISKADKNFKKKANFWAVVKNDVVQQTETQRIKVSKLFLPVKKH